MALLKYLSVCQKKKEAETKPLQELGLPTTESCAGTSLSGKDLECANEKVGKILLSNSDCTSKMTDQKRGKYNSYTPKERAKIGEYAAVYGATNAARHFSGIFTRDVNESTARRLKSEYLQQLREKRKNGKDPVVTELVTKEKGRPLMLGIEMDKAVQEYISSLRVTSGVVNTAIVMGAAEGIVSARDASKLVSHGGHIDINKGWAKSFLKRMGYVKRKASNAGKVPAAEFENLKEVFLADIAAETLMNDIPDELIFNWDQTGLHMVPTGEWTMHKSGDKVIPISHSDDKRQITAVLAATLKGCVPYIAIYSYLANYN